MKTFASTVAVLFAAAPMLGIAGCGGSPRADASPNPVVGAWIVKDPNAPFPYHMYVFNADGTMQQANPDAGDSHASDSDGKGIWVAAGDRIKGKWVEVVADRATHAFTGRLEISYEIKVDGDTWVGTETVHAYDANGAATSGPVSPAPLQGKRVTLR
jgi:hypothetical protein